MYVYVCMYVYIYDGRVVARLEVRVNPNASARSSST